MFKIRTQENKLNHLGSSTTAAHPQQSLVLNRKIIQPLLSFHLTMCTYNLVVSKKLHMLQQLALET